MKKKYSITLDNDLTIKYKALLNRKGMKFSTRLELLISKDYFNIKDKEIHQ